MNKAAQAAAGIFTALAFAAALYFQFRYAINSDSALMVELARRMLAGGKFGVDFYDQNPPLNLIVYMPAVLLAQFTGIAVYHTLVFYVTALCLLSAGLCWRIMRRLPFLNGGEAAVIALAYLLAQFFIPAFLFGERDQIVLLGLLPLLLAQFALNENVPLPRALKFTALVFGAVTILLKPHYGLMPVLMIGWRLWRERRPAALFRADVAVLCIATAAYALLIVTVFPGFYRVVLPDILSFYAGKQAAALLPQLMMPGLVTAVLCALACQYEGKRREFLLTLAAAGFCCLIAYLAQMKGYSYHLIPARIVAFTLAAAIALSIPELKNKKLLVLAGAAAFLLLVFPPRLHSLTHASYRNLPLTKLLDGCPQPCRFFVSNDYVFMTNETALYANAFHASRFAALWFEPALVCDKRDDLLGKYAGMMAQDFARWKPSVVAISKSGEVCAGGANVPLNFGKFYGRDPAFAKEWKHYKFERVLTFNRRLYFPDTTADFDYPMSFDVYRRK